MCWIPFAGTGVCLVPWGAWDVLMGKLGYAGYHLEWVGCMGTLWRGWGVMGTLEGPGCAGYPVKNLGYAWFPVKWLGCVGFPVGYSAERLEVWVPGGGAGVCW